MIVLVELLMAVGIVAIAGSLIYSGYRLGKADKDEEK
jgi:type II secretory pathway pseudopilin PulG